MRTTGIFTAHSVIIKAQSFNKPFNIHIFGDIHKGSPMHDRKAYGEFLNTCRADKTGYFLCTGDLFDIGSSSERIILGSHSLHESTRSQFDELYMGQCLSFTKELEFMRGRILGMIGGNHDATFQSGITATQKVCEILGTKFLGVMSLIRVTVDIAGKRSSIDICVHHGKGGGSAGNGINKVTDLEKICRADVYIMGDNHQKAIHTAGHYFLTAAKGEPRVRFRNTMYIRSGSFLKGYEEGEASYVTDAALVPAQLGAVKLIVTPRREYHMEHGKQKEDVSIDLSGAIE